MTPIDASLISRKANFIHQDLKKLTEHRQLTAKQYLADFDIQLRVERLLERIINRLIDINYHLLKEKYQIIPVDYSDSFDKLFEKKAISQTLLKNLKPAAGLRNVLAHDYDTIDPKKVYQGMQLTLKHIPIYLNHLLSRL